MFLYLLIYELKQNITQYNYTILQKEYGAHRGLRIHEMKRIGKNGYVYIG
jgi:hypothetical protein